MKVGEIVDDYKTPPNPKGISLEGALVYLAPLIAEKHSSDLFNANTKDKEGENWIYLPYGPFDSIEKYSKWIKTVEDGRDPVFFAIIRKIDNKAAGVASYLRVKPNNGSIEVGHINFSPLLQNSTEGTEAMYLMMKWVFENGYRRYEWKCNALNVKSRNAAQRLGFSFEGIFRQMMISKGRNRDTAWFATIDKEWKGLKKCFETFLSKDNFSKDGVPLVSLSSLSKPLLYKLDSMELS